MPIYNFLCSNDHLQEINLTLSEHDNLPSENNRKYTECNVKYGELNNPRCLENAYQQFNSVNILTQNLKAR